MQAVPKGLAVRLIVLLTVIVAVVAGGFGYFDTKRQEEVLLGEMIRGADQLSRSITAATWHAMLADNRESAYEVMQTIGREQGIESLRIFNKEGRVTYSTDPNAARQVDTNGEACFLCHAKEEPLVRVDTPNRARILHREDGSRRMGMVTPIYNESACSQAACHAHPAERSVLGVLDVIVDLRPADRELAGLRLRSQLMTLTEILLIGVFITFFTRHTVGVPIRRLIEGTKAVSEMELDKPIDVGTSGELAELARHFNQMQNRLKSALEELHQFTESLEAQVEERSRQLGAAQQKLIQSDRLASLGKLSASVAHEINNPLSGVLNLSMVMQRILRDDGIPPERVEDFRRYLKMVSEETARVGHIVSDLLAFSRRSSPQRSEADLNTLIRNTVTLVSHKLELAGVTPRLELEAIPPISCDGSQIQQVAINLIMNATEAMPEGGRVTVRTRHVVENDQVLLEVEDQGTGISPESLSHIFDPFYSTKEEGKGVGLGLAVVYGIVDAHGGAVDVASQEGRGTRFTVTLPLHPATHDPARPGQETELSA